MHTDDLGGFKDITIGIAPYSGHPKKGFIWIKPEDEKPPIFTGEPITPAPPPDDWLIDILSEPDIPRPEPDIDVPGYERPIFWDKPELPYPEPDPLPPGVLQKGTILSGDVCPPLPSEKPRIGPYQEKGILLEIVVI